MAKKEKTSTQIQKELKKKARKLIIDLIQFVNNHEENSQLRRPYARAVWNIITALRGPDSDNDEMKAQTTQNIRGAIGLAEINSCGAFTGHATPKGIEDAFGYSVKTNEKKHFIKHYKYAVESLLELGFIEKIEYFDK